MKTVGIWLVIGLVVLTVVKQFDSRQGTKDSVSYSEFMDSAKSGKVESASVEGRTIKWVSTDKKRYITYSPGDIWMVGDLVKYGVKVEAKPEEEQSFLAQIFINEGNSEGVRGDIAFVQSMLETGWLSFSGSQIPPDAYNYAGIYAFDGRTGLTTCAHGDSAPSRCMGSPQHGVLAQIQLLRSYAILHCYLA